MAEITHGAFSEHLQDCLEYLQDWDDDALDDYKVFSLQQWSPQDIAMLEDEGRPALTFDRLRPLIQAIGGAQQTNRYMSTFVAREYTIDDIDRFISNGAREWSRWVQQVSDWEHEESLAFMDCLVCGIGAIEMYMAHDVDPDGRIMIRRKLPWEMLWDPASVQPNMKDATFVIADKWMLEDEVVSIFGREAADEVIESAASQTSTPRREGFWKGLFTTKTTEQRFAYDLRRPRDQDDRQYDARRRRIRLFEMERFEREYRVRVISPDLRDEELEQTIAIVQAGGQAPRLDSFEKPDRARELMSEMQEKVMSLNAELETPNSPLGATSGPFRDPVAIDDFPVRYYYRSWHTRTSVLKEERLPFNGFSHLFLTCHEDWSQENSRHFFGLVRQGKDPQKYTNKFLSQAVHLFSANPKGALIYEEGLFTDKQKATEVWNQASGMVPVEEGKLQLPKLPFIHLQSNVNLNNIEDLLSYAQSSIAASMGLSEAVSLGAVGDPRRVSGEALSSMMEQNIKTQSAPFDSLRLYRKMVGRLLLGFTDAYSDPEQILRVIGEDDVSFVEAMKLGDLQDEFDVIAEEAPTSVNERQEMYKLLYDSGILPQLLSQGIPIPPEMAEVFPGDPNAIASLKVAFAKAYEVQLMNLELQKMQLQVQLQNGGQPPPEQGQPQPPPTEQGGIVQ